MSQITVVQARFDMRCDDDVTDDQVQDLIDRAYAIIVDYLKYPTAPVNTELSPVVISAIRLVAVALFQDPSGVSDPLSPSVKNLLSRSRDPALA